jgi:hypothetical protein
VKALTVVWEPSVTHISGTSTVTHISGDISDQKSVIILFTEGLEVSLYSLWWI